MSASDFSGDSDYQKRLQQIAGQTSQPPMQPTAPTALQTQMTAYGDNQAARPMQAPTAAPQPQQQPMRGQPLPTDQFNVAVRQDQINYGLRKPGDGGGNVQNDYQAKLAYLRGEVGKSKSTGQNRDLQTQIRQAEQGAGVAPHVPLTRDQQRAKNASDLQTQKLQGEMQKPGVTQKFTAEQKQLDRQAHSDLAAQNQTAIADRLAKADADKQALAQSEGKVYGSDEQAQAYKEAIDKMIEEYKMKSENAESHDDRVKAQAMELEAMREKAKLVDMQYAAQIAEHQTKTTEMQDAKGKPAGSITESKGGAVPEAQAAYDAAHADNRTADEKEPEFNYNLVTGEKTVNHKNPKNEARYNQYTDVIANPEKYPQVSKVDMIRVKAFVKDFTEDVLK